MTNEGDARQRAFNELQQAKRNGSDRATVSRLESTYQDKLNAENSAKGSSGQAKGMFGF